LEEFDATFAVQYSHNRPWSDPGAYGFKPAGQLAAYGQATTAAAPSGTITDPKGANLPGAQITVINESTGAEKTLTADSSGFYSVASLVPGKYRVSVVRLAFPRPLPH